MDDQLKMNEEMRLKSYETLVQAQDTMSQTELGYRHMNTRFFAFEQGQMDKSQWADKKKEHEQQKKQIEARWHQNTAAETQNLAGFADKTHSNKEPEYYANYTLEQLEILIKNNDRGGNSEEYNDVATDLELYNAVVKKKDEMDPQEQEALLLNLVKSSDKYITKKTPHFSSGKIRKALITQINRKAKAEHERVDAMITREKLKEGYEKVTGVLQGQLEMDDKTRSALDEQMAGLVQKVATHEVDKDQSPCLTTRFFNALGWTSKKPVLTDDKGLAEAKEKSPIKHYMYTSINTLTDRGGKPIGAPDALPMAKQLMGKSRHYLSDGLFGKGTYLAYATEKPESTEAVASGASWTYGRKKGAVQLAMCLNEHAKTITEQEIRDRAKEIQTKFPKLYQMIIDSEKHFKSYGSGSSQLEEGMSIFAALLGKNAIVGIPATLHEGRCEYAVAIDRSALTMSTVVSIRNVTQFAAIFARDDTPKPENMERRDLRGELD